MRSKQRIRVGFVVSTLACFAAVAMGSLTLFAEEAYWNQFRGPHGDGRSEKAELPVELGDDVNVLWKTPIFGKGWSSPVVWRDQVWVTTAPEDGKKLFALCLDLATGEIEQNILVFEVSDPMFCHPTNSYASCTPWVEEGRIYVHFGTYGTACLDTQTGRTIWERRDLNCDHFRGPASSPIVHGDLLFLTFDGVDVQFVVALDKRTGKTVWRHDRDIDYGAVDSDYKKGYGTPSVIRVGDQWQLVSPSAMATIAYDPQTGRELWRVRHGGMNAAARPLYEQGFVYISAGSGDMRLIAMRCDGEGDVTETHMVWNTGKSVPQRSSLLLDSARLFMVSDMGVVSCLDARSGQRLWSKRVPGEYWASPLYADGRIYLFSKQGIVPVIEAGPEYRLLAKNRFPEGFNASPAVVENTLILRTFTHVYRMGQMSE